MKKRTRVIHVITRLDRGGSAVNTALTLAGLDPERYDLMLVTGFSAESDMSDRELAAVEESVMGLRRKGVRVVTLAGLVRRASPLLDFYALLKLIHIFRRERPDIVHTHTSKAGILGRWAASISRCPCIIHTPHGHVFWGYFGRFATRLFILMERVTARITNRIVALTEQEKKDHLAFGIAPAGKFTIIHSGVDLDEFSQVRADPGEVRKELGIPQEAFVVGTVGRLTPIKGHRFLIEAAKLVIPGSPQAVFVVVGQGEIRADLEAQVKQFGLEERFFFCGWRPDVARIMSAFDLFVLPSLNEGMGKVIVEAMACGVPIVASRIGGITDLVGDGCGLLVPPSDASALAGAILKMRLDDGLRRSSAERGKERAARFSAAAMVRQIDRLYAGLLETAALEAAAPEKPEAATQNLRKAGEP